MRQKYLISKNDSMNKLIIQELGELLDKDTFSLLCEETYNYEAVGNAVKRGKDSLVSAIRTKNMYPPSSYAEKIAEAVIELYREGNNNKPIEVLFDDKDTLGKEYEPFPLEDDLIGSENMEVDDLLIDDADEKYDDQHELDNLTTSGIKLAEDELLDSEEDY
ncbi:MAG: hypothetical protein HQK79_16390 [Desulfobacterales bacterium]|nr:hypothetical protein [Desulfobacterales bacterium]MBF0397135.1 hypothetical protein [Desulfobacterales bacterium]